MSPLIKSEYHRMRQQGIGGIVGQDAMNCLALAKARAWFMEQNGAVHISHAPEYEQYEDVYGSPPDNPDQDYITISIWRGRQCLASLGFVEDDDEAYIRIVENELLCEAMNNTDERDEMREEQESNYLRGLGV